MATVERRRQTKRDGTLGAVHYRVRWRDLDGAQRSRSFARRGDADKWATEVEHRKNTGAYIDHLGGKITLRGYAEEWRKAQVWRPGTEVKVEGDFRLHLYPKLGDRPLHSIRSSDVQTWVKGLTVTHAPATIHTMHAVFHSVMKAAVLDRLIAVNPCAGTKLPRNDKPEIVPPTVAQIEYLVSVVPAQWVAMTIVGAGTGVRVGEALGLTVDRVDFLRRTVRVDRQAMAIRNEGIVFAPTKSKASNRTIPLPDEVAAVLSAHINQYRLGIDELIFHRLGKFRHRSGVSKTMITAVERSKGQLPTGLRFHDLRHFYASMLIQSGASVKTVQKLLGHESAVVTLDTYGHLWPDSDDATRTSVGNVLKPIVASLWPTWGHAETK